MVNYLYDLKRLDKHRALLAQGKVPVSGDDRRLCIFQGPIQRTDRNITTTGDKQ